MDKLQTTLNEKLFTFSDGELLDELKARFNYYHDMEYRFACVLDHATGGMMSKTSYDRETMYGQIDEFVNKQCDEAVKEEKENE